ncbi:hypothetical protein B1A99_34925 [Cohnella sp. CIP 111063]|uniref:DEAD/DEAH box helicase n=1 Tax=unclassified Cohnella TaxID=2636738 RepID=UPI000B8C6616|nr:MULTISPECIES: DEAD/DEAH box helicase [unclassified Cohnella]OXS52153.1 hypothetical protein B1A99_34925 [Cohnella sp. CIP 111063]PRX53398.1 RAD3-like DEAD/DEAH box helicase [Cohnella sp. SGD-V74]
MEYLFHLVDEINSYDGTWESTVRLRNLVCFISDNEEYRNDNLYRTALFEAAQKMRTFGYIKGTYKIDIDEIQNEGLHDIKHQSIQNYYSSKVYKNNLLDKRQKEIIDTFMSLKTKRLIISAPTSFGKTFLLKELLYLNKNRYRNILLVFPTIALLNENTISIKKLIDDFNLEYNVINNVFSKVDPDTKNIYILTPERTLKLLSDYEDLKIDFFFFDEVYKIDEDFNKEESNVTEHPNTSNAQSDSNNRAKAFRITLYLLSKRVDEYYIAGPYLDLDNVKEGFRRYLKSNQITVKQVDFEPTLRIEIDAWKKGVIEHHPLLGSKKLSFNYSDGNLDTRSKIRGIASFLLENNLGQAIFYCANPSNSMNYAIDIIDALPTTNKILSKYRSFIEHLKKRYGVKYKYNDHSIDTSDYWSLIKILSAGYGVHHGKFPKYIQKEILGMFNEGDIDYLFCTSTIIEGVNTNAKNVVIINNSVGNNTMTAFSLRNIKGRAGRYYHHFVGRVFYADKKQRQIEQQDDVKLNFSLYDAVHLGNVDLDNADINDLSISNNVIKAERESGFNKIKLTDLVFSKNRLYPRDIQEKYLDFLLKSSNFSRFQGLIGNTANIQYFLNQRMMSAILDSISSVDIISEQTKNLYNAVVHSYSIGRFNGLMEYQLNTNLNNPDQDIDKIYLKVFDQIRNIIEYEIPRLLCLFESIYQQAGRLKMRNMDDFNLSVIIRFFELGVTTVFGIYLIEYGYPIDAIRSIERQYPLLGNMNLQESFDYVSSNMASLRNILDDYEISLLNKVIK